MTIPNMKIARLTLIAFSAMGFGAAHADPLVYDQPWDGIYFAHASQNDPNYFGSFAKVYDDFTLATTTAITDVHWTGAFFNGTQANMASFLIEIWSDAAGQPGSNLFTDTIVGTANQTATTANSFTYDTLLSSSFIAQAGITYWLSIQPTLVFPPQWGWSESTDGNEVSYHDFLGTRSKLSNDLAFSLSGHAVPEPASLALLGLGLVGLVAARRKSA